MRFLQIRYGSLHRTHILVGLLDQSAQDGGLGVEGFLNALDGLLEIVQLLHHSNRLFAHAEGRTRAGNAKEKHQKEGESVLSQG